MDCKPVRVLHVVGSMNRGGGETWLMNMLRNVDRQRINMDFVCLSGEPGAFAPEIESLGGKVYVCPLNRLRLISFMHNFSQRLKLGAYDVVHSHVLTFSGSLLWIASLNRVPKRFAHFHTSKVTSEDQKETPARKFYLWLMRKLLNRYSTRFLSCSRVAMAAVLGDAWPDNPLCEVLYYGIDLSPFKRPIGPPSVRQEFGLPATAKIIGHVGRFNPAKNHEFLVRVAEELCTRRTDIRFLLVGEGDQRPYMESLVRDKGLASFFVFTGARTDVPRLMQAMDLFLLPSVREGLGIVLIEAQASNLPLITSPLPAFSEVVFTTYHKELPLDSPQNWAMACEEFLALERAAEPSPMLWKALERFSVENCTKRLSELYLEE